MTAFADKVSFYGFPLLMPVQFISGTRKAFVESLDGSVIKVKSPPGSRILTARLGLKFPDDVAKRGDDDMDLQTRLEWLDELGVSARIGQPQNVALISTFPNPITLSVGSDKNSTDRETALITAQGSRRIPVGRFISFSNHNTVYRVTGSSAVRINFLPRLRESIVVGGTINVSPNYDFYMVNDTSIIYPNGATGTVIKDLRLREALI